MDSMLSIVSVDVKSCSSKSKGVLLHPRQPSDALVPKHPVTNEVGRRLLAGLKATHLARRVSAEEWRSEKPLGPTRKFEGSLDHGH